MEPFVDRRMPGAEAIQPPPGCLGLSREHIQAEEDEQHALEHREKEPDYAQGDQGPADHQDHNSPNLLARHVQSFS